MKIRMFLALVMGCLIIQGTSLSAGKGKSFWKKQVDPVSLELREKLEELFVNGENFYLFDKFEDESNKFFSLANVPSIVNGLLPSLLVVSGFCGFKSANYMAPKKEVNKEDHELYRKQMCVLNFSCPATMAAMVNKFSQLCIIAAVIYMLALPLTFWVSYKLGKNCLAQKTFSKKLKNFFEKWDDEAFRKKLSRELYVIVKQERDEWLKLNAISKKDGNEYINKLTKEIRRAITQMRYPGKHSFCNSSAGKACKLVGVIAVSVFSSAVIAASISVKIASAMNNQKEEVHHYH